MLPATFITLYSTAALGLQSATQFAGAANDNLFKFAFTVMVTYQLQVAWLPPLTSTQKALFGATNVVNGQVAQVGSTSGCGWRRASRRTG